MPLPSSGKDVALIRNANNGLFDLDWTSDITGNPSFTNNGVHLVLSLLLEYQGLWWFDDTGKRGSQLYLVKQDISTTATTIKAYADQALQLAVDDGRISSFTTSVVRNAPGRYTLNVNWVMPDGHSGFVPLTIGY